MSKPMKLRCTVSTDHESPWMFRVNATMFDGTPLSFKTERHNVDLSDPITEENPTVGGYVHVTHVAQQGSVVYITLPSPSLEFGKNVNVHEDVLMPVGVTIENFKTRTV